MSLPIPDKITRSRRKTACLVIHPDGTFEVKAPLHLPSKNITTFIAQKSEWIKKKVALARQAHNNKTTYSPDEIKYFRLIAKQKIYDIVKKWSLTMRADFGTIRIKNTTSRWGSCSSKNNLNFHWKLVIFPEEVMEYVVIHELAHVFEKNHSQAFWNIVEKFCPNWRAHRNWLKTEAKRY